ncbi:hypothetical protein QPL79_07390 [Ignisphaera sp. 4213-co]|uniref:Uncharacterized protein n=1 Tax=Ignisphaera cupida TaxID=3050454 RepID=A0ABD4Z7S2_9CREN|nr:hypothetical protein [Ignisphaera sp. 4213-co]MDK6029184.1 hypothetical protein [Ignisphaera sp. 4213-co]
MLRILAKFVLLLGVVMVLFTSVYGFAGLFGEQLYGVGDYLKYFIVVYDSSFRCSYEINVDIKNVDVGSGNVTFTVGLSPVESKGSFCESLTSLLSLVFAFPRSVIVYKLNASSVEVFIDPRYSGNFTVDTDVLRGWAVYQKGVLVEAFVETKVALRYKQYTVLIDTSIPWLKQFAKQVLVPATTTTTLQQATITIIQTATSTLATTSTTTVEKTKTVTYTTTKTATATVTETATTTQTQTTTATQTITKIVTTTATTEVTKIDWAFTTGITIGVGVVLLALGLALGKQTKKS